MKHDTNNTRKKILLACFKLFASMPFDQVTFTKIENATGLSRGAIFYHFENKEILFDEVVKQLIFERSSIQSKIRVNGLWNNIELFLEERVKEKQELLDIGINNINKAFINIECAAFAFKKGMDEYSQQWVESEFSYWQELLKQSIASGEVKKDINPQIEARIFLNIFMGSAYTGMGLPRGYDVSMLRQDFEYMYSKIKNDKKMI